MQTVSEESIARALKSRVRLRKVKAWSGLLLGIPLCLIAPLLLGTLFWFSAGRLGVGSDWTWFFLGTSAVTIPLLIRLEIRTDGNYLGEAARDFVPDNSIDGRIMLGAPLPAIGVSLAYAAANPRAATSGFMEIFLTGPRLVVPGFRHLRSSAKFSGIDPARAARAVAKLLLSGSGVPIKSLVEPGEPPEALGRALHWLAFFDWIGLAEKGDRVFLFSESRETLGGAHESGERRS